MTITELVSKMNIKEPILIDWAIDRIKNDRSDNQTERNLIEDHVFSEANIRYIMESCNANLLNRVLLYVSANRFKGELDKLVEMWNSPVFKYRRSLFPIIVKLDRQVALELLINSYREYVKAPADWNDFFHALTQFSPEETEPTIMPMIDCLASGDQISAEELSSLVGHICFYKSAKHIGLVRTYFLNADSSEDQLYDQLSWFINVMGYSEILFNQFSQFVYNDTESDFSMPPEFFDQDISMAHINGILNEIKEGNFQESKDFYLKYQSLIEDSFLRSSLFMLMETKEADCEDSDLLKNIHAMVLSVILYALMKDEPDFAVLPSSRVFEIIAQGDGTPFYSRKISEYLKTIDKKESIPAIRRILSGNAGNEAIADALYIAGELAYQEMIPCVIETLARLNSPGEMLDDAVALMQLFGNPMSDYLLEHYPELPESCQADALDYFTRTGGGKAVEFLDRYFESLPREMMEFALPLCEAVVYTKALDWLRKRHNKNYPEIQSAFLILSLLSGIRDPIVEERLSIYYQKKKETSELLDNLSFDAVLNKKITSLNLELTCKDCGESNIYPVTKILVYSHKHDPYIAEEIECYHCHSLSNFELTKKGMRTVSFEMARLGMIKDRKSLSENSPLTVIGGIRAFGKEMSLPEAIKRYEQKIRNDPSDAVARFCLGNIYYNTGQHRKSIPLYEAAIELDPAYLQPYHSLAEIEEAGGNYPKALDYLEQGRKFMDSWKYHQADKVTQAEFAEYYREFHLSMLEATQSNCLPIFRDEMIRSSTISTVPKIGRNDPCPCGSGKKYKKCCLAK